jgi:hypothetical protein
MVQFTSAALVSSAAVYAMKKHSHTAGISLILVPSNHKSRNRSHELQTTYSYSSDDDAVYSPELMECAHERLLEALGRPISASWDRTKSGFRQERLVTKQKGYESEGSMYI